MMFSSVQRSFGNLVSVVLRAPLLAAGYVLGAVEFAYDKRAGNRNRVVAPAWLSSAREFCFYHWNESAVRRMERSAGQRVRL